MHELFSQETKNLMAEARLIAIDLGYDYISTMHFFLADCKLNTEYTIRNFAFNTSDEFEAFLQAQKVSNSVTVEETMPLTLEAEKKTQESFYVVE